MHLAIASLAPVWEDKAASLELCRGLAARAAARGASLLACPEMTLTGFTMKATSVAEPADDSPTIRAFSDLAHEHRIAIAFGVVLHGCERPTNSLVVVDRQGTELARYHKLHPFSYAGEHAHYECGSGAAAVALDDVVFGLTICYDLRFPELYASLAERVQAQLVIANWPESRIAHWLTLLQARAIEGQCWVIGVNRTGTDGNGLRYPRSSRVFDPAGAQVAPEWIDGELEGHIISARAVTELRRHFPVLPDRRPDLYRQANPAG